MPTKRFSLANIKKAASPAQQLAEAYDAHGPGLFRYAAVLCASRTLAEDAVQQAFAKLAVGTRIDEIDSVVHYLRTAVRNECYRLLQTPRLARLKEDTPLLEPVDANLEQQEDCQAVESALASLPPDQREVIQLKIYENQTFQQISALLEIPTNTAASRYRYALEKMRERLTPLRKSKD